MNLLSRAIASHHFKLSNHLSRKCLFLPRPITHFQQFSLYFTSNLQTSSTKFRPQLPRRKKSRKSSLGGSQGIKKPGEASPTLPKLSEIPYQPKVANSVSLIGHIQLPVQFHATPDGKHFSATFIAQQKCNNTSPFSHSLAMRDLIIPVVFEGDLAHVVAYHVKENDCVYVTGKLSWDPLPFVLSELQGRFHLLGQEINFIQGLERKFTRCTRKDFGEVVDAVSRLDSAKTERVVEEDFGDSLHSVENDDYDVVKTSEELESLMFDDKVDKRSSNSGETMKDGDADDETDQKKLNVVRKTKYKDSIDNSWRDLVRNPKDWWDSRMCKVNGFYVANYPDFKHKTNGFGLWLNDAPQWVLPAIQGLEFGVRTIQRARVGKEEEDCWKSLVENPENWWDNRLDKKSKRSPDFRHRDTREALWLKKSPDWVLPRLPPLKDEKSEE